VADLRERIESTLGSAYAIERELGGGGMSRVFVAIERALGRRVVLKVLEPELATGVSADRFAREIHLAATLQHPNIVPLLTAGAIDGLPYYVMPFVEGESLRARLTRGGALPAREVIAALRDVTRALAYAHERNVVHRDIKPDNVLVTSGVAAVADFGIARALERAMTARGAAPAAPENLTQLGTALGTPAYMAPEQASGDPDLDERADFYALGCMAYELRADGRRFTDGPRCRRSPRISSSRRDH
jgi:eukaryotic-like serine/threonine-protein kinase